RATIAVSRVFHVDLSAVPGRRPPAGWVHRETLHLRGSGQGRLVHTHYRRPHQYRHLDVLLPDRREEDVHHRAARSVAHSRLWPHEGRHLCRSGRNLVYRHLSSTRRRLGRRRPHDVCQPWRLSRPAEHGRGHRGRPLIAHGHVLLKYCLQAKMGQSRVCWAFILFRREAKTVMESTTQDRPTTRQPTTTPGHEPIPPPRVSVWLRGAARSADRFVFWISQWSIEQRVLAGFGLVFLGILVISVM